MTKFKNHVDQFDEGMRDIQSAIRRYSAPSLFFVAFQYLNAPVKSEFEKNSKQPWLVMLMVQWAFLDPIANLSFKRPAVTHLEMMSILQKIVDLTELGSMPNDFDDIRLFMRALAFQQFYHQTENGLYDLARQKLLFDSVPKDHYFRVRFLERTGVAIADFLILSLAVYATLQVQGSVMQRQYLFNSFPGITPMAVDAFLRLISVDIKDLHCELKALDVEGRGPDEYLRQTPFLRFPLVKVNSQYFCMSLHVLERSLGHFIYDFLKRDDINLFNSPFGKSFEKYVGGCLDSTGLTYAEEDELGRLLYGEGKVVDFMVVDGDANVLIDAKGVEMAQSGMVALKRGSLRRATKTSLIKAFKQGYEVADRLFRLAGEHPVIRHRANTYLLAVTYKELYVGNGATLAAVVAGDKEFERIRAAYARDYLIPIENIYFLTIGEFEDLMFLVSEGVVGLAEALDKAIEKDSQPAGFSFSFQLHIDEWRKKQGPIRSHPLRRVLKSMIEGVR